MNTVLYADLRRHNLHQNLIRSQVVEERVGNEPIDPKAFTEMKENYVKSNGIEGEAGLREHLKIRGIDSVDFEWQLALPLRIRSYCIKHHKPKAEAHFLSRKNQLDKVVYSLIRVGNGYLARELYLRIKAGEANFADLAGLYSEGSEKATNGIIGPVSVTQAHPILAERLRTSNDGELIDPFQIEKWWIVVRLESYKPAVFDEAMERKMSEELFNAMVLEDMRCRINSIYDQDRSVAQS